MRNIEFKYNVYSVELKPDSLFRNNPDYANILIDGGGEVPLAITLKDLKRMYIAIKSDLVSLHIGYAVVITKTHIKINDNLSFDKEAFCHIFETISDLI